MLTYYLITKGEGFDIELGSIFLFFLQILNTATLASILAKRDNIH